MRMAHCRRQTWTAYESDEMNYPFPGMDPYLEHAVLWERVHARLIVAIANQLQPRLDPRYIASVEEQVFLEGPQRRIPDVWIQKVADDTGSPPVAESESDTAVIVEVEDLEVHEGRVEVLDSYNEMRLVALIEVVSPTNRAAGPGRVSYKAKQKETLAHDCHLTEIDLLRRGRHLVAIPDRRVKPFEPFDSLCCVSRWPSRNRFELYPRRLKQRLPRADPARRRGSRRDARCPGRPRAGLQRRPLRPPHPVRCPMPAAALDRGSSLGRRADRGLPRGAAGPVSRLNGPG